MRQHAPPRDGHAGRRTWARAGHVLYLKDMETQFDVVDGVGTHSLGSQPGTSHHITMHPGNIWN